MRTKKPKILSVEDKLSKGIAALLDGNEVVVVVDKKGKYHGIIDDRNIRLGLKNVDKVKIGNASVRAPKIFKEELKDVEKITSYFISGHFRALPVLDKNAKPIGIITRDMLLDELLKKGLIPKVSSSSIMATPLYTIDAEETFGRLKRLIKELHVHRFAVVEKKKIIGVVSVYDLLMFMEKPRKRESMQLITSVKNPDSLKVKQFVREQIIEVKEIEPLEKAVEKMVKNKISYAIVVDSKGVPEGVITALDIFKLVLKIISPKPVIIISGLYGPDAYFIESIRETLEKEVMKISKFVEVGSVSLHFKRGKSYYVANLSINIEGNPLHIREESHDLTSLMDSLSKGLRKIAKKIKSRAVKSKKKDNFFDYLF